MASASDGKRPPKDQRDVSPAKSAAESSKRGRTPPAVEDTKAELSEPTTALKRSSLHKPKQPPGPDGYDFSSSYEQTRRVRFKFGAHSLAVEATLAKLFESLTMECSGVLVQPQWKHFRHFDMVKNDQIRLSNGIWRSWHMKYQKAKEPLFCTFDLNVNLNDHTRPEAVVLEGKYQKRKVEAVAREYRKWRMFHREKFRQGNYKKDSLLSDLVDNLRGDELGDGSVSAEQQAMQVEQSMPAGLIQIDELSDPLFMGLGQDYYQDYNASTNMMFQPKMDVLSSALDEFLGKLEPMEVLLSRTSSSNYQPPLPNFPSSMIGFSMATPTPATPPPPQPAHFLSGLSQLPPMVSPQMVAPPPPSLPSPHQPSLQPPSMGLSSLFPDFGVADTPGSIFPSFSPSQPPSAQSYFDPQTQRDQQSCYDNGNTVTPTQTPPPPEPQFSLGPLEVPGPPPGQLVPSSMFHFPLKRDPSSESLKSSPSDFVTPANAGPSPSTNNPLANPYSFMSPGGPGMVDRGNSGGVAQPQQQQQHLLSQHPGGGGGVVMMDGTSVGGGGGGGVGRYKRRDDSSQFLPGSKRRSPYNSQTDLPHWGDQEAGLPGGSAHPMPPPPSGPALLSARRASIGSAAQLNDRPVLQKNKSEPSGSLLLKEQIRMLSQQHEAHSHELEKQQSLAEQQYRELLHQYKSQFTHSATAATVAGQLPSSSSSSVSGQTQQDQQLSDSDKQLLRTVLSKPALVDILRAILSPSSVTTSPSLSQPTPSPLLPHTPSPTSSSTGLLPSITNILSSGGGGGGGGEGFFSTDSLVSPENVKVTDFQSRLLVAAAAQASIGGKILHSASRNTSDREIVSTSSTPEPSPFMSSEDLLSPVGGGGGDYRSLSSSGNLDLTAAAKSKLKTSRGLSSEQKEVYKEIRRQSHITAEQRRRGTIKQGFDQLQTLVVDPSSYPSGKVSKATVLEKTVEFIERAHVERDQRERQMQALKQEQAELNAAIAKCQENLPASGVPVTRQRFEENRKRFQEYVQKRTLQNYKFWIYSLILQQLFDSYNSTVSTGNQDELCRTVLAWFEQNCSLHALRPVVMNSLKELSTKTTILSDPSRVPHQLTQYAKQDLAASNTYES